MIKAPNETLDFSANWSNELRTGEVIATSSWSVVSGDAVLGTGAAQPTHDDTSATCWLSGGTIATRAVLENTIVTDSTPPRTFVGRFTVPIQHRELPKEIP